jgi:hypothetical protein
MMCRAATREWWSETRLKLVGVLDIEGMRPMEQQHLSVHELRVQHVQRWVLASENSP